MFAAFTYVTIFFLYTLSLTSATSHLNIQLALRNFKSWTNEIRHSNVLTAIPKTPQETVVIVNWAAKASFKVRPVGSARGFSPTILPYDSTPGNSSVHRTILIVTKAHLKNSMEMVGSTPCDRLSVQTGATLDSVIKYLDTQNCTLFPAPTSTGQVTIGGAIAVNAHGQGIPSKNEPSSPSRQWGSLSNMVTSFEAVVSGPGGKYGIQKFSRDHPDAGALLTSVGRTIITRVELKVVPNYNVRAQSFLNITLDELLAPTDDPGQRTITKFLEESGRIEILSFPFTSTPWLKVWTTQSSRPLSSREVTQPYPYGFLDNVDKKMMSTFVQMLTKASHLTPMIGPGMLDFLGSAMSATNSMDLWGPASKILMYANPGKEQRNPWYGWHILTSRGNIQKVMKTIADLHTGLVKEYQGRNEYPINGPFELGVGGVDNAYDYAGGPTVNMSVPLLSTKGGLKGCPQFDSVVSFIVETHLRTSRELVIRFMSDLESGFFEKFPRNLKEGADCGIGVARPEWSKWLGISKTSGPWTDEKIMKGTIPNVFDGFEAARKTMDKYDAGNLYSNDLLNNVLY